MKDCRRCKEVKDYSEFYKGHKKSKDGYTYWCKVCTRECNDNWKKDNPEKDKQGQRNSRYKRRYGITIEDYDVLLEEQQGGCAICERKTSGHSNYHFHVDHCHETGKVRGLLCTNCNRALGTFGDTVEGLMRAVKYLEK